MPEGGKVCAEVTEPRLYSLPRLLLEPGPQRSDRTVRRSSGETLLLVVPLLRGGDGVDDMAVAYLLEEEEVKRRREEVHTGRSEVGTPLAAGGALVAPLCRAGAQAHRGRPAGLSSVLFVKEEEEEEEGKKLPKASCLLFTRLLLVFLHNRYTSWCGLFTQASLCFCVGNKSTCSSSCCRVSPSCGHWFQGCCHRQRADSASSASTVLCGAKIDHGVLSVGHGLRIALGIWTPGLCSHLFGVCSARGV